MKKIIYILVTLFFGFCLGFISCKHEIPPASTPGTGGGTGGGGTGGGGTGTGGTGSTLVCFETDILPIFLSNCNKSGCHNAASAQKGYVLDNYNNIVRNGIDPGRATNSKIYKVLFETGNDRMPQPPNAPLTTEQKALIGRWINEGALNTTNCGTVCDSSAFTYNATIKVIFSTNCTGCHSGTTPNAGIDLSNYNVVKAQALNGRLYGAITHAPGYSPMPKNASKLSPCNISQVKKWIDAGALNN